jgi:hypothetical protein
MHPVRAARSEQRADAVTEHDAWIGDLVGQFLFFWSMR